MERFLQKLKLIVSDVSLRNKILFVLFILVLFRVGATIPVPGVDVGALDNLFTNHQFLGLLNIFSGGGLSNLSIVMLGLGPYITASIIMQLVTIMSPKLKALYSEEGEAGRRKFNQYSRLATVPLALLQGFALLSLLESQNILTYFSMFDKIIDVLVFAAGSVLLMWL